MKKLLALAALVFFASCEEDEVVPVYNIQEEVYVAQMAETANGATVTHTYTYDSNKLLTDTDTQGYERRYSYANDFLTQEDVYLNGTRVEYTIFSYTADKKMAQTKHLVLQGSVWYGVRTRFTYATDGSITFVQYQGNQTSQYDYIAEGTVSMQNGNVTQVAITAEETEAVPDPTPVVTTFTYDGNKAPFKNIFGYDGLCLARLEGGPNNVTSATVAVTAENTTTVDYSYQTGDNGYPAQASSAGVTRTYTYTP